MIPTQSGPKALKPSRREFIQSGTAAAVGTALAVQAAIVPAVHAAGSDVLRVGLIGCGGRGTGAAAQALRADKHVELVALGDVFEDHLRGSLDTLKKDDEVGRRVTVKDDHCFVGFDAYKQVLASGVDVVLLTTPPHFRPIHLKAAVEAGKHVFAEKPVAVDAPGVRAVLAASAEAKKKNLAMVAGLCWRYHQGMREAFQRVHDGAVGDIVALQCSYDTGSLWHKPRQEAWSDMEWQLRNWLYFTWLSGDHILEQHVHSLDKMAWAMKDEYPVKAIGTGGRQVRVDPAFGHIFDHFAVVYEYASGVKVFGSCRQQAGCANDVSDHIYGTKGSCHIQASHGQATIGSSVAGQPSWRSPEPPVRYVPERAQRTVRQHPRGQADQRRRVDGQEHADGAHGPHGGLHGQGHHLGAGAELEGRPVAGQVRVRRDAGAACSQAGRDEVRVSVWASRGA